MGVVHQRGRRRPGDRRARGAGAEECWWNRSTRPGAGGWRRSGTRRGRSCRCRGRGSATGPRWSTRTGPGPGTSWSAGTWRRPGLRRAVRVVGRRRVLGIPRTAFASRGCWSAGARAGAGEDPSPRWSVAFWVADADQAAARTGLGGRCCCRRWTSPSAGSRSSPTPRGGLQRVGGARRARPWPGRVLMVVRVPFTGDEKQSLRVSLDRHRDAVLWKPRASATTTCGGR